jgi:hypothetical protein
LEGFEKLDYGSEELGLVVRVIGVGLRIMIMGLGMSLIITESYNVY